MSITHNRGATAPQAVGTYDVVALLNNPNYQAPNRTGTITIAAWTIQGFFQPDMGGVVGGIRVVRPYRKFRVYAGTKELRDTSVVKSMQQAAIACTATASDDIPSDLLGTGGTYLRYDTTGGRFVFWQTDKAANRCYQVILTTQDGSSISVNFKTK